MKNQSSYLKGLSPFKRQVSEDILRGTFKRLCSSIDSPRSLAAWLMFKNNEFHQLVNLDINPGHYDSDESFADDYLVTKYLSKYPGFKHEMLEPRKIAIDTFLRAEAECKATNKRFLELFEDPHKWDPLLKSIFASAKRKISKVLGDADLDAVANGFGWGPGATSVAHGNTTSAYVKFSKRLDVTSNALIMGHCCVNSTPAWVNCQLQTDSFPSLEVFLTRECFSVVRGNQIVFVPKNAKTDRTIAIEPHVNSYLQKGFGRYMRNRLKRFGGVDLKDQTLNQRLAKLGSLDNSLATIDLQAASDTISTELVRYLLPNRWFTLLDLCRSKQGYSKELGYWVHYEKFSSMGNGFTFELESLIFWALTLAASEVILSDPIVSVYGDDIIVNTDAYELVDRVLGFAGFTVNKKKSFSSGCFRESCGADYFRGTDVRPIFLKEKPSNAESLLRMVNSLRRYAHRRNSHCGCDATYLDCWQFLVRSLPSPIRTLKVPEGVGDVGLISNFDEATPSAPGRGWSGYVYKALLRLPLKRKMANGHAAYVAMLSVVDKMRGSSISHLDGENIEPMKGFHTLRKSTKPKVNTCHTFGWYDLGPWN